MFLLVRNKHGDIEIYPNQYISRCFKDRGIWYVIGSDSFVVSPMWSGSESWFKICFPKWCLPRKGSKHYVNIELKSESLKPRFI